MENSKKADQKAQGKDFVLEDDELFEEFEEEDINPDYSFDEEEKLWQEDWDYAKIDDEFSVQLRAELDRQTGQPKE